MAISFTAAVQADWWILIDSSIEEENAAKIEQRDEIFCPLVTKTFLLARAS